MNRIGRPLKYPWDRLAVGDEIFVPAATNIASVRRCAHSYANRHNLVFTTRGADGGIYIRRVA